MIRIIDLNFLGHEETIAAFLVETSEGPLLIETGPHSTWASMREGLKLVGYSPEDIRHVLLTHIHLDHAGAAWAFAQLGATIYVHPAGIPHLIDPSRLLESARRIYAEHMDRLWGELHPIPETSLKAVAHKEVLIFGDTSVHAWHTPGHAIHHIAWEIGEDMFCGDVAGVRIGEGPVVPPCPPPDIHVEDWQASIALLKYRKPERLWLTHYGAVDNPEKHLNELEARLLERAAWMKSHAEANRTTEELTPLFQAYSKKELEREGLDEEMLVRYENANPAWMSVAGLLRYWKKKLH
jgi:glyoxylase-like metal-dependent hydrolase (beta-lactamase superfamily II)